MRIIIKRITEKCIGNRIFMELNMEERFYKGNVLCVCVCLSHE